MIGFVILVAGENIFNLFGGLNSMPKFVKDLFEWI